MVRRAAKAFHRHADFFISEDPCYSIVKIKPRLKTGHLKNLPEEFANHVLSLIKRCP
jgi:hypothetical protein